MRVPPRTLPFSDSRKALTPSSPPTARLRERVGLGLEGVEGFRAWRILGLGGRYLPAHQDVRVHLPHGVHKRLEKRPLARHLQH
eukprot:2990810-Pyramimonas_sp.AAC.1